jgi:hypothetical protein
VLHLLEHFLFRALFSRLPSAAAQETRHEAWNHEEGQASELHNKHHVIMHVEEKAELLA